MVMCEKCGSLVMLESSPEAAPLTGTAIPEPPSEPITNSIPEYTIPTQSSVGFSDAGSAEEELQRPTETPSPLFQDVVDFGNVNQPAQGFGALVYDLKIQGVDTVEIREEVTLCLTDSRLQLDVPTLMGQIEKGVLLVKQINPVKASVILTRMRHLPLSISWSSQQLIKTVIFLILIFSPKVFSDDYAKLEADLKSYALRITVMQDELRDIIKKKDHNTDPALRDKFLDDIKKKDEEIKKTYDIFRSEKERVIYEHPEQGDATERTYRHVKIKTLAELESESGVDGQLTRIKHKVEKVYPKSAATPPE